MRRTRAGRSSGMEQPLPGVTRGMGHGYVNLETATEPGDTSLSMNHFLSRKSGAASALSVSFWVRRAAIIRSVVTVLPRLQMALAMSRTWMQMLLVLTHRPLET